VALNPADRLLRKAALERLASPEQLDELVPATGIRAWVAAFGLLAVAAVVLGWGVFGSIATEVPAQGIVVAEGGRVVGALTPSAGIVVTVEVKVNDAVTRGQTVATVRQAGVALRLEQAEQVLEEKREDLETRQRALNRQLAALEANAASRRDAYSNVLRLADSRADRLRNQLRIRERLRSDNLALEERVEQARADLAQAEQDAGEARARLVEIETDLLRAQLDADKELNDLQSAISDARRLVDALQGQINETRAVLAPADGRITEVTVIEGQLLQANQLVLNLETEGRQLQAVVYVPTEHGKKVSAGMPARIALSTVKQEEWGSLLGRVARVSPFPSSPQGMAAVLQNQQLVQSFGGATPPFEARIDLIPASTSSGYAWSSGQGPPLELTSGTTLRARIAVQHDAPLDLILPYLRRQMGLAR
jgi:HlyD family secretion protein